jgi:ion channel POLLUX/CASTOR
MRGLLKHIHYKLDNLQASSAWGSYLPLIIVSLLALLISSLFLLWVTEGDWGSNLWTSWTYLADPGTHVEVAGHGERMVAVLTTMAGMIFFALLVGLVSEQVGEQLNALRSGKTAVLESGHIVVIGWSNKAPHLIKQIIQAEKSRGGMAIAVLSDQAKEQVEEELFATIQHRQGIRIICRQGSPDKIHDLKRMSVGKAKQIVVLSNPLQAYADAYTLKLVLSLVKGCDIQTVPITVEVEQEQYKDTFTLLERRHPNLNVLYIKNAMGRLIVQSADQSGLSSVYAQLLDYYGDSFHLVEHASFLRKNIAQLHWGVKHRARVCGVFSKGLQRLVFRQDYVFSAGDQLMILSLSAQNVLYRDPLENRDEGRESSMMPTIVAKTGSKTTLIVGWSNNIPDMLQEMARLLPESKVYILSRQNKANRDLIINTLSLSRLDVVNIEEGDQPYATLLPLLSESLENIVLIPDSDQESELLKDTKTLSLLMFIRHYYREQSVGHSPVIISEIFDAGTKELMTVEDQCDYIISDELVSKLLATVSYSTEIKKVWDDLLSAGGNLIKIYAVDGCEGQSVDTVLNGLFLQGYNPLGYVDENTGESIFNGDKTAQWDEAKKIILIEFTEGV